MSKPIKLTEDLRKKAVEEFSKAIADFKMTDGKISYNKNFTYGEDDKAEILFTPIAYTKMLILLRNYDSEVAWHGVGKRIGGAKFLISDIVVYPQTVTGGNVEMDTDTYAQWIIDNIEDERFNHIIMQGHSHVNAGTTPSSVDLQHQDSILSMLTEDMYYIFMIWNKKLEHTTKIYDLQNNTLYENKDISYGIADEAFDIDAFIKEASEQVKKKTVIVPTTAGSYGGSYGGYGYGGSYGSGYGANYNSGKKNETPKNGGSKAKEKQKGKSEYGGGWQGRGSELMEDEAFDFRDRFNT